VFKETEYLLGEYNWVHCDEFFTGYYTLDYTSDNWDYLAQILRTTNSVIIIICLNKILFYFLILKV
jgi:hypothetical protein